MDLALDNLQKLICHKTQTTNIINGEIHDLLLFVRFMPINISFKVSKNSL